MVRSETTERRNASSLLCIFSFALALLVAFALPVVASVKSDAPTVSRRGAGPVAAGKEVTFVVKNSNSHSIHSYCGIEGEFCGKRVLLSHDVTGANGSMKIEMRKIDAHQEWSVTFVPEVVLGKEVIKKMKGRPFRLTCTYVLMSEGVKNKALSSLFFVVP
jgi:hypothetical protein